MASYLLVANETAESQELLDAVSLIHAQDPGAEFVIVVPATPLNFLQQFEGTAKSARGLAAQRAQSTRQKLESFGIRIRSTRVANWDPYIAIEEELANEKYEAIVVSTLPPGLAVSRGPSPPKCPPRSCSRSVCGGHLHVAVAELSRLYRDVEVPPRAHARSGLLIAPPRLIGIFLALGFVRIGTAPRLRSWDRAACGFPRNSSTRRTNSSERV